jgi:hypothetical protein
MRNIGCIELAVLLMVVGVPALLIAVVVHGRRSSARAREEALAAARDRGERITALLERLHPGLSDSAVGRELSELLHDRPVGYVPELLVDGGWFDRASSILTKLAQTESDGQAVAAYFRCFLFPAGYQAKALAFLDRLLRESGTDNARLAVFTGAATSVLATSTAEEARWLYERTLAAVRTHRAEPAVKAVALTIGRLVYSINRPNREPTIYDEQAIANDIAAQSP